MNNYTVALLATLLLSCPPKEVPSIPQDKINRIALAEALKAGQPGTVEFTVALRRVVSRLSGNTEFERLPVRLIETDATYARNLFAALQANPETTVFNGSPVTSSLGTTYDSVVAVLNLQQAVVCSGIAITATRIITAEHCLTDSKYVVVGNDTSGSPVAVYNTKPYAGADVGLIFLSGSGLSTTAFLPRANTAEIDTNPAPALRAMGFGQNAVGTSGTKLYTDVAISRLHCSSADVVAYGCSKPVEMVADAIQHNAGPCEADSGGPAFIGPETSHKIAAIISRPVPPGNNCVQGEVYIRLDSPEIKKFIEETAPD